MSGLVKGVRIATRLANRNLPAIYLPSRNHGGWNKDFKPGKYPETEAERLAAAKKYNLLPEEYKPYPDDGLGYGDYPHLPDKSVETKDPYYPYDYPALKRNFGEPIHAEYDYYGETRFGTASPLRYPIELLWVTFLGVMAALFGIYFYLDDKRMYRPVVPKQLPGDGKTHYTFDLE